MFVKISGHHRSKRGVQLPGYENTFFGKDGLTDWCRANKIQARECKDIVNGGPHVQIEAFPPGFFDSSNISLRLGVIIYTIVAFACVLMTLFFSIILILGWRTHFQFPIYRIILQLSISYLLLAISQFFTNIPMYIFNYNNNQDSTMVPFFIEQTVNYASILFYTLLTLNRLVIFTMKPLREMFTGSNLYISVSICWLLAISASAFMILYGCTRTFDARLWLYQDVCAPQSDVMIVCYGIIFYTFYLLPFLNLVMYIVMGASIFSSRSGNVSLISKAEIALLKQSLAIFIVYMIVICLSIAQTFQRFTHATQVYITTMLIGVMDPLLGVIFVGTFIGSNRTVQKTIMEQMPIQISKLFGKQEDQPEPLFVRTATQTENS